MRLTAAAMLAAGAVLVPVPAGATDLSDEPSCVDFTAEDGRAQTDAPSIPLELLDIEAAHAALPGGNGLPGAGQRVAVVDSGVFRGDPGVLDVVPGTSVTQTSELLHYHGTAVAGLIAGKPRDGQPTGVAPGAQIVDVRVYDAPVVEPGEKPMDLRTEQVVEGLEWVAANAEDLGIGVATVALRLPKTPALKKAVRAVAKADVVLVVASGNRPQPTAGIPDPLLSTYAEQKPGEDALKDVFPAGYVDDVVAVNATAGGVPVEEGTVADPRGTVLQNSATDVAVPTWGGVSVAVNGGTCVLPDVATSWAAAEVSGIVALLRAAYPEDKAPQIVARLKETASGSPDDTNALTGAGVVQPLEALTRRLTPDAAGDLGTTEPAERDIPPAVAPEPEADILEAARSEAVWWGLFGGAAVVLSLMLRPIIARRRR